MSIRGFISIHTAVISTSDEASNKNYQGWNGEGMTWRQESSQSGSLPYVVSISVLKAHIKAEITLVTGIVPADIIMKFNTDYKEKKIYKKRIFWHHQQISYQKNYQTFKLILTRWIFKAYINYYLFKPQSLIRILKT